MRYSVQESTYILAIFNSGDTVTIDIYDLDTDGKIVDGESCSEIGTTGVFKYKFTQAITGKKEYLWIMTNGTIKKYGKIVLGGWIDEVKDRVKTNLDEKVSTRASQTSVDNLSSQLSTHDSDIKAELGDIEGTGFDPTTHSLVEIKGKVDEVDSDLATHDSDIKAELGNIEGTGFTPDTHSLVNIKTDTEGIKAQTDKLQFDANNNVKSIAQNPELANLDAKVSTRASSSELATHDSDIKNELSRIEGAGFDETTDSLEKIRDKVDEISVSAENVKKEIKRHDAKMTGLKFI